MNNTFFIVDNNYLSHYGMPRRSGRYPYGSGDRPYQDLEGKQKSSGIRGYFQAKKKKKAAEAANKQRSENLQKAREAAAQKRQHEADKERVLKSGTAKEVLQYQGELSNKELQDAFNRINLERSLARIVKEDAVAQDGWKKMDATMKKVGDMTRWAQQGINAYNVMARVYNVTEEGQKKPLKTI